MTDPRFNPATGHGVECLCDECFIKAMGGGAMKSLLAADAPISMRLMSTQAVQFVQASRVITVVMDDGLQTKDGAA